MKKFEKETIQAQLTAEDKCLKELEKAYKQARTACQEKIRQLNARTDMQNLQSVIHQKRYQEALLKQIDSVLNDLQTHTYKTANDFFRGSYQNGYIGSMYELHKQGIPITMPVSAQKMITAIQTDSKLSRGYYMKQGLSVQNIKTLKRKIAVEATRGIASGKSWLEVAESLAIQRTFAISESDAMRIARTEGNRINQQARLDAGDEAIKQGCDLLKQWDATLDEVTRPAHREADGQIVEWEENFTVGGEKMKAPSVGGSAANVINCRCQLLKRPRWALDEEELEELKKRAEFYGLNKTKDFEEYKNKYLHLPDDAGTIKLADTLQGMVDDLVSGASSDRQALGASILQEYGVQGVSVNVKSMTDYGYCSITVQNGRLVVTSYNLCAGDKRSIEYQIKTAFHEAYHASGNGFATDILTMDRSRWLDLEETFAECTAHYMATQYGITGLTPSYAEKLVKMLPRLKGLAEFKGCKTIADFGKVAQEARQNGGGSVWKDMSRRAMRKRFSYGSYTQQYFSEIRKDIPGYVDKILENMPDSKPYRKDMIDDLTKAMDNIDALGFTLSNDETFMLDNAVAVLMNTVGVL